MKLSRAVLPALAVMALAGCASTTGSTASPAASVSALASAATAAAAGTTPGAAASSGPCDSHSCIASELDQSLTGGIDQADAVATKVKCSKSSVKDEGNGNYTTWCTVTYSDGTTSEGYGTVDTSAGKVTFQPED